jgi:hypothetical protein
MSDYLEPISDLSELNDDECLSGYRAGLGFIATDYTQKSRSYWHGYRNGQVDRGLEPMSPQQSEFARKFVAVNRVNGMH